MATFVLLHGGMHGGWCYQPLVAELRRRGHDAYAPTLTGHGERSHLQADVTMETHVLDVANLITYEDLDQVVLVGHSMGGVTIPLVAERVRERIGRVVWMASTVLGDGESIAEHYAAPTEWLERAFAPGPDGAPQDPAVILDAFMQDGTPEQRQWTLARLGGVTPPLVVEKGDLTGFLALHIPTGYIVATHDQALPPELCRRFAARLPGCLFAEVDAGHDLMITAPTATADALVAMS
ncbi:MAG TPA: alpha/beta hydrolase [Acidimicrobiales bacterium]